MRKAKTNDLFKLARLIRDLDLKQDLYNAQHNQEDPEKIGFDLIFDILEKATSEEIENKIYEVLSGPFEMDAKDIGSLDIDKLLDNISYCFDFSAVLNFLSRASK